MIELSSLAGCELLLAGSRSAAARADAEQRRRDPVVRVPGVRGHRQRHGHHPWERAAAVRKGVCSVDGASVRFKPNYSHSSLHGQLLLYILLLSRINGQVLIN